jgi:spoIIIJ-associated protein
MPEVIEFQGKNVEQALESASEALNIPTSKIKHEVIAYGSTGIFGLVGVKKARIKVFVQSKTGAAKPKNDAEAPIEEGSKNESIPVERHTDAEKTKEDGTCDAELIEYGQQALEKIVKTISEAAQIHCDQESGKLIYRITGGQSGVLIGKRGQTLEAMQYLLEKMVNKKSGNRMRGLVDVEG